MRIATLAHKPADTTAWTWLAVHWLPLFTSPAPAARCVAVSAGCSLMISSAYSHETEGSLPAAASVANCCHGRFLPAVYLMNSNA